MIRIQNYINGVLVSASSKRTIDNNSPADGKVFATIPDSDQTDVNQAVEAAESAFLSWSNLRPEERYKYLIRISELIEENLKELAEDESLDNGKPVSLAAAVDIPRASSNFQFYATAGLHFASEAHHMSKSAINYTIRQPLGVVGCISPWNLPLYLFSWKIAPALAAGNTVVAKPSEITPLTAFRLSEICIEAGLPAGVLNIVHGYGHTAGEAIVNHDHVKAISFTGGTNTGSRIAALVAPKFKKLSLELGGKNPNIIFADCDYKKMLKTTVKSSFANQGQICLCGSRIFVESNIYNQFRKDFVDLVSQLKVSHPRDPQANMGAVVSEAHMNKILSYIELAKAEGGKIICGGKRIVLSEPYKDGFYLEPTVIEGLSYDCRVNQEEIFGPVVTIQPFETEQEVLQYANSVRYGLSSTVWTQDLSKAHRLAEALHVGIVWINTWLLRDLRTPFGGVKDSGVGREGGFEALRFFTEPKNVCIRY